jgi:hypothetical protein
MPTALDSFRSELNRIDQFSDRAKLVADMLEQEAVDTESGAMAARAKADAPGASPDEADFERLQADEQEAEAEKTRQAKLEWRKDVDRVYVLRLVTAFEVFLREFVIEKASDDQASVQRFLQNRVGLHLGMPLELGAADDQPDRIAACVDATCETFSNLDQASGYFRQWFGTGFLDQELLASPLADKPAKDKAIADVRILLQLRHILVHKSGIPNAKYHGALTGDQCCARLDPSAYDAPSRAKPPDAILSSPAKYAGNNTKKDDLYQSLLNLAEHIDGAYPFT